MFDVSFCPTEHRTHLIFDGEEDLVEVVPEEVAGDEEGEAHAQDDQVGPDHLRAVLHAATLITALIKLKGLTLLTGTPFPLPFIR